VGQLQRIPGRYAHRIRKASLHTQVVERSAVAQMPARPITRLLLELALDIRTATPSWHNCGIEQHRTKTAAARAITAKRWRVAPGTGDGSGPSRPVAIQVSLHANKAVERSGVGRELATLRQGAPTTAAAGAAAWDGSGLEVRFGVLPGGKSGRLATIALQHATGGLPKP